MDGRHAARGADPVLSRVRTIEVIVVHPNSWAGEGADGRTIPRSLRGGLPAAPWVFSLTTENLPREEFCAFKLSPDPRGGGR